MATERTSNQTVSLPRKKAKRSLRSILTLWFLLFSIVPLSFVTGYSLVQFEAAINGELNKRLRGNAREIEVIFNEFEQYLIEGSRRHSTDPALVYNLSTNTIPAARRLIGGWMEMYSATRISLFDRDGRLTVALAKNQKGEVQSLPNLESGEVYLVDETIKKLESQPQINFRDVRSKFGLELIVQSRVTSNKGVLVGYIEEIIGFDIGALAGIKKRLNLDIVLFDSEKKPVVSTLEDFLLIPATYYKEVATSDETSFFELTSRDEPYGFMLAPLKSAVGNFNIGLAASKKEVKAITKGINRALSTILAVIIGLLIVTLFAASNMVMKPINHLVEAAQRIEGGEVGTQIPIETETEIGLLTVSFNKMSKRIAEARAELESKIAELEAINKELKETQQQLVQSAKMVSLGQLVAGVAHELNNPIGFIYSNMEHLRDYSSKLVLLIEAAEKKGAKLEQEKVEAEFDYIKEDLPRLIRSCEDGARRVRDIVIGLRNFSRLDEHQNQVVDLEEGLKTTLNLLSGELKNRVEVETHFSGALRVSCFANQINQVFMNLLSNAAQAIEGAGKISVSTQQEAGMAVIEISDTGKGIAEKNLGKIFDPFFTTKPVGEGTGLGLSISYGIIEKHGGKITVRSKEGQGSTFTIKLPLANA